MKIAFIISSLGSGGAERVATLIANELAKRHEVYIVTFSKDEPFYSLEKNIKLVQLDLLKKSKNSLETIKNTFNRIFVLTKTLHTIDADVNISFMTHTNILSTIASKIQKQKIIICERIAYGFYQSKMLYFLRRVVYPMADLLITQTKEDRKNYKFLKNVKVIYNPINIPQIQNNKEKIVLAVGRLEKQKGFDSLIKAFAKIKSDWKLVIAGEGSERKNLENLIRKLSLEKKVFLIGKQKDIFDWYAKASLFVLSSKKEGFPNVLLEAMGSGCASISFDCPYGPREIIENGKNGILVEDQNIDALVETMQKLIDDKNLREKLSKEAVNVREKYNIKRIASEWEEVIEEVIGA
ncbi:glycosyltransferase family 4 protein [Nitratiruptor sp. YY09-18]|uniref:glycosyltransferase family 4 protein n=1 Tax=Nitratiruptor sp. YY09-18 TaxID=2724901 RepID=UPI0019156F06|nr:glycosyltransferase family 4 protein [Nitratiruptor sp. YY09-18]BCD67748.1 GalNAc-alpha-(1->4)-GalNAc-alpha-(1->3)-diNAcBac-PP-undecaprenol alpha-1,4-N-acetyl-D-galactosaminyltransferase [Nitratiruptor sp. YY09-18]